MKDVIATHYSRRYARRQQDDKQLEWQDKYNKEKEEQ